MRRFLAYALAGVLAACGSGAGRPPPASPPPVAEPTGASNEAVWYPADYTVFRGSGPSPRPTVAAWKWVTPIADRCKASGVTCFGLQVIVRDGCAGRIAVTVVIKDHDAAPIASMTRSLHGVAPLEPAAFVFMSSSGAASALIDAIDCS